MKAIEIPIANKVYRLTPVGVNYDLNELGKTEKGQDKVTNIGYSMSLSRCIDRIAKDNVGSDDEVMTLKEYVDALSDRYTELKDLVEIQF